MLSWGICICKGEVSVLFIINYYDWLLLSIKFAADPWTSLLFKDLIEGTKDGWIARF